MNNFLEVYKHLNKNNLELLETIYAPEIHFVDPAHEIHGIDKLREYFKELYANVNEIDFTFSEMRTDQCEAYVQWQMCFIHPKLKRGSRICVDGVTFAQFRNDGKVIYHRDYFDLGSMLYEQLPLLGTIISSIKRRLGS